MRKDETTHIEEYALLYNRIEKRVSGDKQTALAVLREICKDRRTWLLMTRSKARDDEPATEPQLRLLKRLKVDVPESLTKSEASRLIDEARGREGR